MNWAGFYVRDDKFPTLASPVSSRSPRASVVQSTTITTTYSDVQEHKLLLGPFQGKPACQLIFFGKGVCGTAALKKEALVVDDVLEFPGHIACDADSRSEIVVPVVVRGEVGYLVVLLRSALTVGQTVAIIDVDCTEPAGFDDIDRKYLEEMSVLLAEGCDW